MGGFTFENAREVMCWVNFVLQRPASGEAEQPPDAPAGCAFCASAWGVAACPPAQPAGAPLFHG